MATVQVDKVVKLENIVTSLSQVIPLFHQLPSLQLCPHHYLRFLAQESLQKFLIAASLISSTATVKFTARAEVSETNTVTSVSTSCLQGDAGMAGNGGNCCFSFLSGVSEIKYLIKRW